jgi:hypothetical protein
MICFFIIKLSVADLSVVCEANTVRQTMFLRKMRVPKNTHTSQTSNITNNAYCTSSLLIVQSPSAPSSKSLYCRSANVVWPTLRRHSSVAPEIIDYCTLVRLSNRHRVTVLNRHRYCIHHISDDFWRCECKRLVVYHVDDVTQHKWRVFVIITITLDDERLFK